MDKNDLAPKRNGKFVNIEYAEFTEEQNKRIMEMTDRLREIFKGRSIKVEPLYGQVKIYIDLAPEIEGRRMGTVFRVKGVGEYRIRVNQLYKDDFTGIVITLNNHIGYSNDPYYSGDYETKEKQLEVWIGTPNFYLRRRWAREPEHFELQPHFDYAYEIDTLYEETILPAVKRFIQTFKTVYPELT